MNSVPYCDPSRSNFNSYIFPLYRDWETPSFVSTFNLYSLSTTQPSVLNYRSVGRGSRGYILAQCNLNPKEKCHIFMFLFPICRIMSKSAMSWLC